MKNRDYKVFAPNQYYHIYNRGNGKADIFKDEADFRLFLSRLEENLLPGSTQERTALSAREGRPLRYKPYVRKTLPVGAFTLLSYTLMPNHFHFLIRQNSEIPISKLIAKICTSYGMYFNKKYNKVGNLLQSKFRAILIDNEAYLLWLSAYIHQNPKVAGLVSNLEDYPWSSYPDYIGKADDGLCDTKFLIDKVGSVNLYKKFVEESFDQIKQKKDLKNFLLD